MQKAKDLVPAVRVFAVGSYADVLDRFPGAGTIADERWDFIVTRGCNVRCYFSAQPRSRLAKP